MVSLFFPVSLPSGPLHFPSVFPLTLQHSLARAGHGFAALADAVAQGLTTEAKVDTALKRALRQLFTVGLFDQPSARPPRVRNKKGTRVLISLWDSLMLGRVPKKTPRQEGWRQGARGVLNENSCFAFRASGEV